MKIYRVTQSVVWFALVTSFMVSVTRVTASPIHPVILVPGVQGCQLQGKLVSRGPMSNENVACKSNSEWFTIWTNIDSFLPVDCWINNMRLLYNRSSRTTHNIPGVFIRPSYFGDTRSVETLSPFPLMSDQIYMKPLVDSLVGRNYTRNKSVRAAPYDFRKAANEQKVWMSHLKWLIEETYMSNGNTAVNLIAHSMGGMLSYIFLRQQSSQWKDQFIHQFISIATPYGGSISALKALATGHNVGIIPFKDRDIHSLELSYPIVPFLLPSRISWSPYSTLLDIASIVNITLDNYSHLFQLLRIPHVAEMYLDVKDLMQPLVHPGVNVVCIYSTGKQTPAKLHYQSLRNFPFSPSIEYGDGDAIVNRQSLEACSQWSEERNFNLMLRNFNGISHLEVLKAPEILETLVTLL